MSGRFSRKILSVMAVAMLIAACGGEGDEPEDAPADSTEETEDTTEETEPADTEPAGETGEPADGGESEAAGASCEGVIEPLESGYPEEPITLLVVDEAGSADGIFARAVQRSLQKFSPVDINVVDRPDFGKYGNYEAADWVGQQPGGTEGYIAGVIIEPGGITDLIATDVVEALGAHLGTFNYVMALEQTPYGLYTPTDMPWGDDVQAFIDYGLENPGELVYMSRGGGSGIDLAVHDYMTRLGIEYESITGGSFTEIAAAVAAGEADFAMVSTEIVEQFHQDGRVEALAVTQDGEPVEALGGPPRMKELTGQEFDPWGRTTGFYVDEETPDENRDWLADAMQCVSEDEEFIEARGTIAGNTVVALGHEEFSDIAIAGYTAAFPILEDRGLVDPSVEAPLTEQ